MEHSRKYDAAAMNVAYTFGKLFEAFGKAMQEAGEDLLATADQLHDADEPTAPAIEATVPPEHQAAFSAALSAVLAKLDTAPNSSEGPAALSGDIPPLAQDEGDEGESPGNGPPACREGPVTSHQAEGGQKTGLISQNVTDPGPGVVPGPGPDAQPDPVETAKWKIRADFSELQRKVYPRGVTYEEVKAVVGGSLQDVAWAMRELQVEGFLRSEDHPRNPTRWFMAAAERVLGAYEPAGDAPRAVMGSALVSAPTSRVRDIPDEEKPKAEAPPAKLSAIAKPAPPKPTLPPPTKPILREVVPVTAGRPDCRIGFDDKAGVIVGPLGRLGTGLGVIRAVRLLARVPGHAALDARQIAAKADWRDASLVKENLPRYAEQLAGCGIRLVVIGKGDLFRLELAA